MSVENEIQLKLKVGSIQLTVRLVRKSVRHLALVTVEIEVECKL